MNGQLTTGEIKDVFSKYNFNLGRIISFSKSTYIEKNPNNLVYFNANILTKEHGKVWYGDLDLTKDQDKLHNVARELSEDLYVLREADCPSFEDVLNLDQTIKKAIFVIRK